MYVSWNKINTSIYPSLLTAVTAEDRHAVMSEDVLLTCSISQLLNTVSVQWRDSSGQVINSDSDYTVNQGSKDESGNQYSTLQISTTKLQTFGATTVTYTCQVFSGDDSDAITKTMTLTLYDYSKLPWYLVDNCSPTRSCFVFKCAVLGTINLTSGTFGAALELRQLSLKLEALAPVATVIQSHSKYQSSLAH